MTILRKYSVRTLSQMAIATTIVSALVLSDGDAGPPKREKGFFDHIRNKPHWSPTNQFRRAGHPKCISRFAKPFPDLKYTGYHVGGGAALYGQKADWLHGQPRCRDEGTFGLDYSPWYSRVRLQWFHGKKYQAGEGQYEADHANNPLDHHLGFGPFRRAKLKLPDPRKEH